MRDVEQAWETTARRDGGGAGYGYAASGPEMDTPEISQALWRLRESEDRYRALVTTIAEIVWTTGPDGLIDDDIPAWRVYTGQSVAQVRGLGWLDAAHPEDRAWVRQVWTHAIARRTLHEVECRIRRHDGAYRAFWVHGVPVLDEGGAIREWIGYCRDVTERHVLDDARRETREAAGRGDGSETVVEPLVDAAPATGDAGLVDAAPATGAGPAGGMAPPIDAFLSIASHELRTPLTSVKGNVQLAQRNLCKLLSRVVRVNEGLEPMSPLLADLTPALGHLQDLLGRADGAVMRLTRLVNDLLDVSRIQQGRLELWPQPCDLAAIVRQCVEEHQQCWPARAIILDGPDSLPVEADAVRVAQVVTNYLTNALKYSPEHQAVQVTLCIDDDANAVVVRVRDGGPGLTPGQQDELWDRFRRVHDATAETATRDAGGGLGLGLYISRMLIERHGGRVGVESSPGAGSTFWFALPHVIDGGKEITR